MIPIRWVAWGDAERPAVVLLHGARANWHWWQAAAGELVRAGRRVVAPDLSGHGDSGHRGSYSPASWAAEVAAVAGVAAPGRVALAGHSMGGLVAIAAAAREPELVTALVLVDVKIHLPDPRTGASPRGTPARRLRTYDSLADAVDAFRLLPEQPIINPDLVRHVAARSARPAGGGWRWKFDPAIAQRFDDNSIAADLGRVRCPVHLVHGAHSALVSPRMSADVATLLGRPVGSTEIAGGHHHVILDRPAETGRAVAAALASCGA